MKGAQADMKQVFFDALHKKGIIPEQELSMETLGRIFGPLQKQVRSLLRLSSKTHKINLNFVPVSYIPVLFADFETFFKVAENLSRQESVMAEVQQNHEKFAAESGAGSGGNAREDLLKSIAAAHDAFFELKGNLQEGTKFYNDLTQLLVTFQNKVVRKHGPRPLSRFATKFMISGF